MYELFDETATKVLLAVDRGDSIRQVAKRIGVPYETVRQAVNRLESAALLDYDDGLSVTDGDVRDRALDLLVACSHRSRPTIGDAYVLPNFAGLDYAFTRIDAVYVWTLGGYQVSRNPDDYPIFLAVREGDVEEWHTFFDRFDLPVVTERHPPSEFEGPLQIVIEPRATLDVEIVEGRPVVPRSDTIEYMEENYATFQSALDMLDRMYDDLTLDVDYRASDRAQP